MGKQTPLSIINGIFVASMLFFTTLFGCILTQFIAFVCILPFSRRGWKIWNNYASATWYIFVVFLLERWNGVRVRISGDTIKEGDAAIMISNHPSEADWFFAWSLGWRFKGNVKIALKKELQFIPGLGWSIDNLDYVFLSRKWDLDEAQLKHSLTSFVEDRIKMWFFIFPEGTDFSKAKQQRSWDFADKNGGPKYRHLLCPRTKGFTLTVDLLHGAVDALYDITVQYPNCEKPSFWSIISGTKPNVVNIHVKRYPIASVPKEEEALKQWCYDRFQEKDDLLEHFKQHNSFPGAENTPFAAPGKGIISPPLAFLQWLLVIVLSIYGIYSSQLVAAYFLIGWAAYAACAHSKTLRRLRGLDPPLKSHKKEA